MIHTAFQMWLSTTIMTILIFVWCLHVDVTWKTILIEKINLFVWMAVTVVFAMMMIWVA